jgi:hypothetical protein
MSGGSALPIPNLGGQENVEKGLESEPSKVELETKESGDGEYREERGLRKVALGQNLVGAHNFTVVGIAGRPEVGDKERANEVESKDTKNGAIADICFNIANRRFVRNYFRCEAIDQNSTR